MTDRAAPVAPSNTQLQLATPLASGLAVCIFVLDLLTPVGTGEWVLYLLPLLLASRSASRRYLLSLSAGLTGFMVLGFALSPPGGPTGVAALNRFLGAWVLWVTTVLVVQRRGVERALSESEENFRLLFIKHPLPVWVCDPETLRFVEVNEAAVTCSGYARDEFLHMRVTDISVEEDVPRLLALLPQGRTQVQDLGELRHRRKDGQVSDVHVVCGPATFAGRGAVLATLQDVTERKRAEHEQARLEAALRRSELMSALGSLVVGVAHEVRNPLFGISATLDAFETRFAPDPAYQEYFNVLRREVQRMNQLTRDLLEYGKPRSVALTSGSIEDVIADAVNACAPLARETGVQVVTHVREQGSAVRMDPPRLREVFENLIQNAIQHSPRGAVVLVEADQVRADDRTWVHSAVKDSGSGFRTEDLPRIFEPFFTRRPGGTGLGLSIAQRIVEEHGGTIAAHNDAAGGARVEVRLPGFA
jgi:PAS domain S-box-containing protein